MTNVKRLCPECGAANPMDSQRWYACGANLRSDLPVPLGETLPVSWKQVGASLVVGAAALALRVGAQMLADYLERRAAGQQEPVRLPTLVRRGLSQQDKAEEPTRHRRRVRAWGRRAWGSWQSDGASHVEVEEFYWQQEPD
jgi:hypothetical protein